MDNPRPANVAVVEEVQRRFHDADGAILTEYRGLKVKDLAGLRRSLRPSGGDYKIYKNTLVRLAAQGVRAGRAGAAARRARRRSPSSTATPRRWPRPCGTTPATNPLLVLKGGVLGGKVLERGGDLCPGRAARPARCCWPASPACWRRRCSNWPACCRPCPATSPTAWPPCAISGPPPRAVRMPPAPAAESSPSAGRGVG